MFFGVRMPENASEKRFRGPVVDFAVVVGFAIEFGSAVVGIYFFVIVAGCV